MEDPRADRIRSGYAPVARAYREHLQDELTGKPLDRALLEAFAELCRGGPIADIGCGPGHVARYLADRGADVEGIDLSPEMIAEAQAWHPAIAFRVGDMFALPHADGALAGAALFYAIVHLAPSELGGAFREVHRVLAPGGRALVAFHVGDDVVRVDELFGCATSLEFRYHRPDSVTAALADAGFVIEARLDRAPHAGAEYPSQRCYVLAAAVG